VAARALLARDPRPTAVFAAQRRHGRGPARRAARPRVAVPAAMAVAGFDDIAIARYLTPPLTTVSVDMSALGRRAVQLLLEALGAGESPSVRRELLPARLVVRESCGCMLKLAGPRAGGAGRTRRAGVLD